MGERVRPFTVKLKIGNLDKNDIKNIIENIKHLDGKSTITDGGKIMKLDFPATTAFNIGLEEFGYTLIVSTGRRLNGSQEKGFIHFGFSEKTLNPAELKQVRELLKKAKDDREATK